MDTRSPATQSSDSIPTALKLEWRELPEGWEIKRLEELVEIVSGSSLPTEYQNGADGETPVYKVSDMNSLDNQKYMVEGNWCLSNEEIRDLNHTLCPAGTTILPKVGAALLTNKRRLLSATAAFDNNIMAWVPEQVNPEFLYYVSQLVDMEAVAQPGAVPSISKSIAGKLKVPVPPREEQRKIASVLYTIDELIEKTRATEKRLQKLKVGLRRRLLSEGTQDHQIVFDDTDLVTGVAWSEVGDRPESWEVINLASEVELITGGTFSSADFDPEDGIPLIRIRDLGSRTTETNYTGDYTERYVVRDGDVLVGMDGEFRPHRWQGGEALLNQRVCKIQASEVGGFLPEYLQYALYEPLITIENSISGTTVKHLSTKDIRAVNLPKPLIEEQREIIEILSQIEIASDTEARYRRELHRLKKGLMQDLLTGEVRTDDVDIDIPEELAAYD